MPALKPEVNVPIEIALKYQSGRPVQSQIDGKDQMMFTLTTGDQLYVSPAVADQIDALGVVPGEPFGLIKREVRRGVKRYTEFEVYRLEAAAQREYYAATTQNAPTQPMPGQPAPRASRAPAPPPQPQRAPQAATQLMDQGPPVAWDDIPEDEHETELTRKLSASIVQAHSTKQQPVQTSNVRPMPPRTQTTVSNAQPMSLVSQVLSNALISAFDAAQIFEQYAAARNVPMRMDAEQIKCMAISIYIDLQKNVRQSVPAAAPRATTTPSVNGSAYRQ